MMHIVPFIILCLIAIFGSVGNVFIIGAVCLQKKLRVRGNIFVVNLAIADLIITSYIMPIGLATSQYKVNPFGQKLCEFNAFLILTTCGVSTQSLMMIAFERYFHICKVHWYKRIYTKQCLVAFVLFTWIYTIVWTCQGWTGWTVFIYGEDVYVCMFDGTKSLSYDICLTLFGMVFPMLVLSFCYFNIFRTVRKSRSLVKSEKKMAQQSPEDPTLLAVYKQKQKKLQRENRLIWTLFTIVILFVVFWSLAAITLPLSGIWKDMPKILYTISVWLALTNSSINSVVYGAMNKNFRTGYYALFKRIFWCCYKNENCHCQVSYSSSHDDTGSTTQSKINHQLETDTKQRNNNPESTTNTSDTSNVEIEMTDLPKQTDNCQEQDSDKPVVYNKVVFLSRM